MIATFLAVPGVALAVLACAGRAHMLDMGWSFLAAFAPLPAGWLVGGAIGVLVGGNARSYEIGGTIGLCLGLATMFIWPM